MARLRQSCIYCIRNTVISWLFKSQLKIRKKLKILLLTIGYPPYSIGGTEVYVQALARELLILGHKVSVIIPSTQEKCYQQHPYVASEMPINEFRELLNNTKFDVVHAHPLTSSQFLDFLQGCKQRNIPIIVTYHTPTLSCSRGNNLLFGREECDGAIKLRRCTACVFHAKGLPPILSKSLSNLPGSSFFTKLPLGGKLKSMFSIPGQVKANKDSFSQLAELTECWVAVSQWVRDVLYANGVPQNNIILCRQAVCNGENLSTIPSEPASAKKNNLRLGYIGRIHPFKGLHVLIHAIQHVKTTDVEIHIVGERKSAPDEYLHLLDNLVQNDSRIKWRGSLKPDAISDFYAAIDVLVVPSIWMETGPMTVLEAWKAGVQVIGSDRGGIREWIVEHGGGRLFTPGDAISLAEAIDQCRGNESTFQATPKAKHLYSMRFVAQKMANAYDDLARH